MQLEQVIKTYTLSPSCLLQLPCICSSTDRMMPPKKSKAARAEEVNNVDDAQDTPGEAGDAEERAKNIFQETVVEGKRKRTVPPVEAKIAAW